MKKNLLPLILVSILFSNKAFSCSLHSLSDNVGESGLGAKNPNWISNGQSEKESSKYNFYTFLLSKNEDKTENNLGAMGIYSLVPKENLGLQLYLSGSKPLNYDHHMNMSVGGSINYATSNRSYMYLRLKNENLIKENELSIGSDTLFAPNSHSQFIVTPEIKYNLLSHKHGEQEVNNLEYKEEGITPSVRTQFLHGNKKIVFNLSLLIKHRIKFQSTDIEPGLIMNKKIDEKTGVFLGGKVIKPSKGEALNLINVGMNYSF